MFILKCFGNVEHPQNIKNKYSMIESGRLLKINVIQLNKLFYQPI
jgi:hypothetical protein